MNLNYCQATGILTDDSGAQIAKGWAMQKPRDCHFQDHGLLEACRPKRHRLHLCGHATGSQGRGKRPLRP